MARLRSLWIFVTCGVGGGGGGGGGVMHCNCRSFERSITTDYRFQAECLRIFTKVKTK